MKKQCVPVLVVALVEWSVAWCCGHSAVVLAAESGLSADAHAHRHHHGPFEHSHDHGTPVETEQDVDRERDGDHERDRVGVRHLEWDQTGSAGVPSLKESESGAPQYRFESSKEIERYSAVWVRAGPCPAAQSGRDTCLRTQQWLC